MGDRAVSPPGRVAIPQVQGWSAIAFALLMFLAWAFPSLWPPTLHAHLQAALQTELLVLVTLFVLLLVLGAMPAVPKLSDKIFYWTFGTGYLTLLVVLAVYTRGLLTSVEAGVLILVTYGALLWLPPTPAVVTVYLFRLVLSVLFLFLLLPVIIGAGQAVFGRIRYVDLLTGAVFFGTLGALDVANVFVRLAEPFIERRRVSRSRIVRR